MGGDSVNVSSMERKKVHEEVFRSKTLPPFAGHRCGLLEQGPWLLGLLLSNKEYCRYDTSLFRLMNERTNLYQIMTLCELGFLCCLHSLPRSKLPDRKLQIDCEKERTVPGSPSRRENYRTSNWYGSR